MTSFPALDRAGSGTVFDLGPALEDSFSVILFPRHQLLSKNHTVSFLQDREIAAPFPPGRRSRNRRQMPAFSLRSTPLKLRLLACRLKTSHTLTCTRDEI